MSHPSHAEPAEAEDSRSEFGGLFERPVSPVLAPTGVTGNPGGIGVGRISPAVPVEGVTRRTPPTARAVGRGPVPFDPRKFKYDRNRAQVLPSLVYGATRADRMDAEEAGDVLDKIHAVVGIDRESEDVIAAFDKALFFEHAVNGASLLQAGRGSLFVGKSVFELAVVKKMLGVDQRRFFRAYADEIADVNREVLGSFDPYDPAAAEKYGQLMQVAVERGLQKYPHLVHDSSDAGLRLSIEERIALVQSKRVVLPTVVNNADRVVVRPPGSVPVNE